MINVSTALGKAGIGMFFKLLLGFVVVALLLTMVTGNVAVPLVLGVVFVVGVGVLEYLGESDSGSTYNSERSEDSEDFEDIQPRRSRRCPYCGSPIRIKGNRWECGYCGDCGDLSSLRR